MMDQVDPPLADAWPSLADATAMVPKVTSNAVISNSIRPLATPRGMGWKSERSRDTVSAVEARFGARFFDDILRRSFCRRAIVTPPWRSSRSRRRRYRDRAWREDRRESRNER